MTTIRVLHVDDEPSFGDLASTFLEREDDEITVVTETDPVEGLSRLQSGEEQADCIVSDYDMPRMNGLEFLDAIRDEYPDLPFILFTGKGSEEIASEAISKGATDYLQKKGGTEQYELLANRVRNVAEKYRSTKEAEQTRRRLENISESTSDCLWMFDRDWEELLFISGYEDVWKRSSETLEKNPRDFLNGVHPDDRAFVRENMRRLSDGESIDIEYRIQREDGTGWVWVKGDPVFGDDGSVDRVVGFVRDITERKQHERKLERYEQIVENLPVGVFRSTPDGELVSVNGALVSLLGAETKEEILETPVREFWADTAERAELLTDLRQDGGMVERIIEVETLDGQQRWLDGALTLTEEHDSEYLDGILRESTKAEFETTLE